jgi:hypothetical protein
VSDCLHTDPAVQERLDGGINLPKTVNRIRAALPGIHRMSRRLPRKGETHTQNGITILVVICVVTLTQVLMLAYSQRRRHEDLDERLDRLENKLDA